MIGSAFARRKSILIAALAAALGVVLFAGVALWRKLRVSELAHIGAGYAAEQTCACIFISRRALASCMTDLDPLAQRFVSVRVGTNEVTAHALGLGRTVAQYEEGFGCSLRD